MTGMILDAVLMLLLVAALGYGVRLEKKLSQLRAGQLAFAGAVTELNAACGRAENALGSLRASGEEADLLHDRIVKARALKTDLEALIARAPNGLSASSLRSAPAPEGLPEDETSALVSLPSRRDGKVATGSRAGTETVPTRPASTVAVAADPEDRAFRMAALAERIHGLAAPGRAAAAGAGNVQAILHALTANQAAKQSLNRTRPSLDDDLFAA